MDQRGNGRQRRSDGEQSVPDSKGAMNSVSAGPELELSIACGAMLYDASRVDQPGSDAFERDRWRARGVLEEVAGGRGTVAFIHDTDRRWVLRHYRRGGFVARLLDDTYLYTGAARTRAYAEFRLLRRLREWKLPVPVPVAARYQRAGPMYRADLLTEELPTRLTLAQALGVRTARARDLARHRPLHRQPARAWRAARGPEREQPAARQRRRGLRAGFRSRANPCARHLGGPGAGATAQVAR